MRNFHSRKEPSVYFQGRWICRDWREFHGLKSVFWIKVEETKGSTLHTIEYHKKKNGAIPHCQGLQCIIHSLLSTDPLFNFGLNLRINWSWFTYWCTGTVDAVHNAKGFPQIRAPTVTDFMNTLSEATFWKQRHIRLAWIFLILHSFDMMFL